MSAVSRWHTAPVFGLMFTLACASPPGGDEATPSVRTRSSAQPLTSLGPTLTFDINRSTESSAPNELLVVGERVFFTADDGVTGRELYVSDGTPAGTVRVKDLFPGPASSTPGGLALLDGQVYFFARSSTSPGSTVGTWALWKTDGTEAGTTKVIGLKGDSWPRQLARGGNRLYFANFDADHGDELWKTDGTEAGTVRVKDIREGNDGSFPNAFVDVNGVLFFSTFRGVDDSPELWRSDGTEAGTVRVAAGIQGFDFAGASPFVLRSVTGPDGTFDELWGGDGTAAGLTRIKRLWPEDTFYFVWSTTVGGRFFFYRSLGELWTSDGTEAGTVLLKKMNGGRLSSTPSYAAVGGWLYFAVDDGSHGQELWVSDGTVAGTRLFADLMPGAGGSEPSDFVSVGGVLYFSARDATRGRELWRTHGVDLALVHDIVPDAYDAVPQRTVATASGQTLFFRASDGVHGQELWKTDGTSEGTTLTRDLATRPAGSGVTGFARLGTRAFFAADDGLTGRELWVMDGTPGGTRLVRDFLPGAQGSNPRRFTEYQGSLFFVADNEQGTQDLWKTDGTPGGTMRFDAIGWAYYIHGFTELGGSLLFRVGYSDFWKTDGTQAGTVRYKRTDDTLRSAGNDSAYEPPAKVDGVLYSLASTKAEGLELWRTDGTASGTFLLMDARPGTADTHAWNLRSASRSFYFTASEPTGAEVWLWKSDGTGAGTARVAHIASGTNQVEGDQLAILGDAAIFEKRVSGERVSLWRTDGTPTGTVKLYEAPTDVYYPDFTSLTTVGSQVFFVAEGPNGRELWRTDGTPEGTREVKDIRPPRQAGLEPGTPPTALTEVGGQLYFAIDDVEGGEELWRSDGTAEGTARVVDLSLGSGSSRPRAFTPFGDGLLIVSDGDSTGVEPRLLAPSSVTCPFPPRQEATSSAGASVSYAPALLADGVPTSTSIQYSHPPGSVFPLGSTTVQATADASGFQVRHCDFVVTVSDTTPPSLQCPSGKVVETSDDQGAAVQYPPATVADSVSTPEVTYSLPSGSRFTYGRTLVEVTATDAAHNTATCSFPITVQTRVRPPGTESPQESSGCGCDTASPAVAWWLLLLLIPTVRRRVLAPSRD
ncbi:ELWxxDGT repeat protein [Pyxidicoccus sp. MSG2]|uniref:ELWxxDGT repeat protein n=1 Tax=Pyxidicoccus sp. MSG2 TaxID=2996790 RepID=UPI00226FE3F8|nr:ELWxxDGT repeat protein [Pyxidicoccus sp. MSG2]MCY1019666.1 HYR domain-containing protein [Pyxidicoccus sp. MSG2]